MKTLSELVKVQLNRNIAYNVTGAVAPAISAILFLPMLFSNLGDAQMGLFAIAIAVISTGGLLDFGLSRALTYRLAAFGAETSLPESAARLIWTVAVSLAALACGTGLLIVLTSDLVTANLQVEGDMIAQATSALHTIALMLPLILISGVMSAALEGFQQFGKVNAVRGPVAILNILAPALATLVWPSLTTAIAALLTVRCVAVVVLMVLVRNTIKARGRATPAVDTDGFRVRSLLRFGGWMSVSNILSPLFIYLDRFYLATLFPSAAIAAYAVPFDVFFRVTAVPGAAANALFPKMTEDGVRSTQAMQLGSLASKVMVLFWGVPFLAAGLVLEPGLGLWLGDDFAAASAPITLWVLLGIMANGFSYLPYTQLQAGGRSDVTALLHVVELPIYVLSLVVLVQQFGLVGAAMAWALRAGIDFLIQSIASAVYRRAMLETLMRETLVPACMILTYMVLWLN